MKNCLLAACIGVVLSGLAGCGPTAQPPEAKVSGPRTVAAPPANVERKPGYAERLAMFKEAVQKGRLSEVRELLKNGQDVNDRDDAGQTPLIWAASKGNMAIFWLLLSQGALATERDAQGRNALMHAADGKQTEVVQALVAPNQALQAAGAALKLAGVEGKLGFQGMGKSLDEPDNKGQTALMLACRAGGEEAAQLLYDAGADNDRLRDSEGQTALMLAAAGGHRDIVNLLLQRFANSQRYGNCLQISLEYVRSPDHQGKTAADLARLGGHKELAEYLEDYARNPEALDEQGQTALHRAVDKGDSKKFGELIWRGANPFLADAQGRTAAVLATTKGDAPALGFIIGLYPRRKDTVAYFNLADKQGLTALMHAATQGHAHCVQSLLGDGSGAPFGSEGFDVFILALTEAADKEGHNALMLAAAKGHTQVVRSLLQAFGDNNLDSAGRPMPGPFKRLPYLQATDKAGKTALQIAQDAGHVTVVKVLKEFGAQ